MAVVKPEDHFPDDNKYKSLVFICRRKIADDRGFYFLPTILDFADISDIRQRSVPDLRETIRLFVIEGLRGLVMMSEIHRRRTPTSPTVQI